MSNAAPQGLAGAWVPVAASVSGKELLVAELRVKFLVLDGHDYNIIDRSNQIVDRGEYLVNDSAKPWAIDIVGRRTLSTSGTSDSSKWTAAPGSAGGPVCGKFDRVECPARKQTASV